MPGCVSVCPAVDVTKFLGPTAMRQEMRLVLDPRDSGDRITDAVRDGLFTCTTCQACWKVCPKKIEIPGKAIEKLRAHANKRGLTLPRHLEVAALIKETGRSIPRTGPSFLEKVGEVTGARRPGEGNGRVLHRLHVQPPPVSSRRSMPWKC